MFFLAFNFQRTIINSNNMKKIIVSSLLILQSFFCFSQSLNFDGVDDYLEITPLQNLSETSFTLEVWVKIPVDTNNKKMNLFSLKNCVNGFNIYLTENGFPEFKWYGGPNDAEGSINYIATSIINVKDNEWHHLTFIRNKDQDKLMISIDGSYQGTISSTSAGYDIPLKGVNLVFGENLEDDSFGRSFLGSIDDLSLWKRYLSEEELKDRGSCVSISLQDFQEQFSFGYGIESGDNTSITHAASSSGSRTNCKLQNFSLVGDRSNYIDSGFDCVTVPNKRVIDYGAINFDGNDDFLQLGRETERLLGAISTSEVWVKIPLLGTNGLETGEAVGPILGNYPDVSYGVNANGQPAVYWNKGEIDFAAVKDLRDNQWHHIAYVRNVPDNKFSIYIDGVEDASFNSAGSYIATSKPIKIGGDNKTYGANGFHGILDDIRLWPEYLTKEEITISMNSNFEGTEPFIGYKFWSFNIGEKPITEVLSHKQSESGNNYYMSGFSLVGHTSNFVEGHKNTASLTNHDIIDQRMLNGQTLLEIASMLKAKIYLFSKEFNDEIVFDYNNEERSFSLVGKVDLGNRVWGVESEKDHDNFKTLTDNGSGYSNTLSIVRIASGPGFQLFPAYLALTQDISKKTFLPSVWELAQISANLNAETKLKYFNKEYSSSSSLDAANVHTYNIVENKRLSKRKSQESYVLHVRKLYEAPSPLKSVLRITDDNGWIFQNMGQKIWTRYHPDKESYQLLKEIENSNNQLYLREDYCNCPLQDPSKIGSYAIDPSYGRVSNLAQYYRGSSKITNVETSLQDKALETAITIQTSNAYRSFAQFEESEHKALTAVAQSLVFMLDPSIKNYEDYLALPNKDPLTAIEVEDKLDDKYWDRAKTQNTEGSYLSYCKLDTKLNRNHINEAIDAYNNYEYFVLVKMSSIVSSEAFDGLSTEATLELVWDIQFNNQTISNTFDVEKIDYPNRIPGLLDPLYIAPPSFPLPFNKIITDPFNGNLYGFATMKNNDIAYLSYKLYDEDGRTRSGNEESDKIGEEKKIFKESDLTTNAYSSTTFSFKSINLGDTAVKTTFEISKMDLAGYAKHIRVEICKCSEIKKKPYSSGNKLGGPGFLIRNETDFDLDISLDNFGPLYYGLIKPGGTFRRDTGPWLFDISAATNFTGVSQTDVWDAVVPVVDVVLTAVSAVWSGGGSLVAKAGLKGGIYAAYSTASQASKFVEGVQKVWKIYDKLNTVKGLIEKSEEVDNFVNNQFDKTFTFAERTAVFSGIWGSVVPVYRVVGGPKLPCLDENDQIVVRESEPLEIKGPYYE